MRLKQRGFTLVEALVALVILSMVFAAVWNWFSGALTSTSRIEQAIASQRLFDEFISRLSLEQLHQTSSGEYDIDDFHLQWQATPERNSLQEPFVRQPYWNITLYNVDVFVFKGTDRVTEFTTQYYYHWQHITPPSLEDGL